MFGALKDFLKKYRRKPLWVAPAFWQIIYALLAIWFGTAPYFGAVFRETRLNWLAHPPYNYIIIALGLFGIFVSFFKWHVMHVLHGIGTVFLLSFIFLTYFNDLRLNAQTTGVYFLLLVGAIWLCIRIAVDKKVYVTWLE